MENISNLRPDSLRHYSREEVAHAHEPHRSSVRWTDVLGRNALQAQQLALHSASIYRSEDADDLQSILNENRTLLSFVFVLFGEMQLTDIRTGQIRSVAAGSAFTLNDPSDFDWNIQGVGSWVLFRVPLTTLRERLETLTNVPYVQEIRFPAVIDFKEGEPFNFYQMLSYAEGDIAAAQPPERSILAKVYEDLLLVKLITKFPHNLSDVFNVEQTTCPRPIRQAEAFMLQNVHNPVTLNDIAAAAGCSPRTLQREFREYRNATPIGILCNYRLATAHNLINSGAVQSITDLAMSLQFSNPGRFSILYRKAYGQSPSAALRSADVHREHVDK